MTTFPPIRNDVNKPPKAAIERGDLLQSVLKFIHWLEQFGQVSYDFQSFYAGRVGQSAKALYYRKAILGTVAVAPIIFCEAFVPSARRLFWKPQRFPIADAHYAMGLLFLAQTLRQEQYYAKAVGFLKILENSRCEGYKHYCWGYPFHWETIRGTIRAGTPLITTVPYVYEAFRQAYQMDDNDRWLRIMRSIAQHALEDYKDFPTSSTASTCSYTPNPEESMAVVNANAYRAFLLTSAAVDFSDGRYLEVAKRNLAFVLESQNPNGSWYYAVDGKRHFVDHFHTCFVLKALAKIEKLTADPRCGAAIERGIDYYAGNLFDSAGLPKPFSRPPRLTVYRKELYDYAECLNLGQLLKGRFAHLDRVVMNVLSQILTVWQRPDGSFRSRQLLLGWDNTPMHRWAQSQMFRSLCSWLAGWGTQLSSIAGGPDSSVTINENEAAGWGSLRTKASHGNQA
jgi:hypothetical protein